MQHTLHAKPHEFAQACLQVYTWCVLHIITTLGTSSLVRADMEHEVP